MSNIDDSYLKDVNCSVLLICSYRVILDIQAKAVEKT